MDFPKQEITIFHLEDKKWIRYNVIASFRNTSILNRNKNGVSTSDTCLIRIFDEDKQIFKVDKQDVIVNKKVSDDIVETPLTYLQNKYNKNNVYQVKSVDIFRFGFDLDHTKIGCV